MKANRIREKYEPREKQLPYSELLKRLKAEEDIFEIEHLLCQVRNKKRKSDPAELIFLINKNSVPIDQELALTFASFKHPSSRALLQLLCENPEHDTRLFAARSILKLYGREILPFLEQIRHAAIQAALKEWDVNNY